MLPSDPVLVCRLLKLPMSDCESQIMVHHEVNHMELQICYEKCLHYEITYNNSTIVFVIQILCETFPIVLVSCNKKYAQNLPNLKIDGAI